MIGRLTREQAAAWLTRNRFAVRPRTLERWRDLPFVVIGGRAWYAEADLAAAAERRMAAAVKRAEARSA